MDRNGKDSIGNGCSMVNWLVGVQDKKTGQVRFGIDGTIDLFGSIYIE